MPYQEMLKNYEEARSVFREFSSNEGHYKTDVAKTLEYMEKNYMYRLTLSSISANVNLSSSYPVSYTHLPFNPPAPIP